MSERPTTPAARADLVADTALALLAERGMRGLTHRAVDETAGLPRARRPTWRARGRRCWNWRYAVSPTGRRGSWPSRTSRTRARAPTPSWTPWP